MGNWIKPQLWAAEEARRRDEEAKLKKAKEEMQKLWDENVIAWGEIIMELERQGAED